MIEFLIEEKISSLPICLFQIVLEENDVYSSPCGAEGPRFGAEVFNTR